MPRNAWIHYGLPSNGDICVGSAVNSIYMFNQAGQRKDTIIGRARTGDV